MDSKEWLRKHEREVFKRNQGCFDKAYIFGAKNGFEAGQQSKQAEIDALKNKLSDIYDASDENKTVAHLLDEIQELLK